MLPAAPPGVSTANDLRAWLASRLERELDLPLLPEAASRVVALCEDPNADVRDVQRALEADPSLASNFLRIANSALYAGREPVVSLRQAISRLGLETARAIAIAESTRGRVFSVAGHEARVRAIWRHSVVAAAFAREVARTLRRNVEGAFLCALLHDVGRPIVLQSLVDAPRALVREPLSDETIEAMMDELHAGVGARLAKAWRLADWTASALEHHHEPDRAAPFEDEARIVRLADLLSDWALAEDPRPEHFPASDPVIGELELYRDDLDALLALRQSVLDSVKDLR
jgi:putative nucleotidyltransferase with HDIG domain